MHEDPIMAIDCAASSLASIQLNLSAGTLTTYLGEQPSLAPLIRSLLRFDVL